MKHVCFAVTILATILAGFTLFSTFISSESAPQQAAGAAMAAAMAVIPYVFSRCVEKLSSDKKEEQNERIITALKILGKEFDAIEEAKKRAHSQL